MNLYIVTLIFLFALLMFIFYLKGSLNKKVTQRSWLERIETIAKENHTLWSLHVPYFQNNRICNELLELEKDQKENEIVLKMSNKGGWHSSSDILKYPSIKRLFRRLLPHIESYSQMQGLDKKYLTVTAWANINRKADSNVSHNHEDALFSGCYYLKAENNRELKNGGISFFKKNENKNLMATFSPEPGDFLLFPSDMIHNVHPYHGEDHRVSIAFNIHFGNKKKSWFISQVDRSDVLQKIDPFHDLSGQKNAPAYIDDSDRKSMLFHTSSIKRFLFK